MFQKYRNLSGEDLEMFLQDKRLRDRTGTPAREPFTGPCDYTYRGFRVVLVYDPTERNPYGGRVTAPGGKPEALASHFLEAQIRREAQHVIEQKLEPRPVSAAEQAYNEWAESECESDA